MKIGKLKKKTVKELEKLRTQLYNVADKVSASVDKAVSKIDDAISHVESLEIEKKSKKVKQIKLDTPKLPTSFEQEQKRRKKAKKA